MNENIKKVMFNVLKNETVVEYLFQMYSYDMGTFRHMLHTSIYSAVIAEHYYEFDKVVRIAQGAALHDIGKIMLPLSILNKPEPLEEWEYEKVREHPGAGNIIVKGKIHDELINDIILHHHEHPDGCGYPDGLAGNDISREVSIVTMVDVFDAMTQARAYHNPISAEEALRLMEGWYDTGYMGILKNYIRKEGLLK